MLVKVRDLLPNPFRRIERYPIRPEKVEALRESLRQTGFWDNVVARRKNGRAEIAYGHHRLRALQEEYGPDREVNVILRDLEDAQMLQIMAAENMEEWGTSAWVEMETVQAVLQAFDEGRIELAEPSVKTRDSGMYRTASGHAYSPKTVADFLAWYERDRKTGQVTGPSYKVFTAISALDLIAKGVLSEGDFAGLGSTQAMALVDQTRRALRDAEVARLRSGSEEERQRADEREFQGREQASRIGKHLGEEMRAGRVGYKGAATAAEELLTPRDTVPHPMDHYALRVAQTLNKLLAGDKLGQEVDELIRYRDQLSPQRVADLVVNLRDAGGRLEAAAKRFGVSDVNGAITEDVPGRPALTG